MAASRAGGDGAEAVALPAPVRSRFFRTKWKAYRTLADHVRDDVDLLFVGINPGGVSAARGHHYAHRGNVFWPLLNEVFGLELSAQDDARVVEHRIGLTNLCDRMTPKGEDLCATELRAGFERLHAMVSDVRPVVVCFVGKGAYETASGLKCSMGAQAGTLAGAKVFVMPSTSGRGATYSRADKKRFFVEVRDLLAATKRAGEGLCGGRDRM